ncbi:MAG: GNAT family N-acetyltransferase [Bacillota bacterium]|uniref:Acetoin utilization protein AcuA n=2 Tax=Carboxydocella TaxID=178898 RepID=A0A1T4QS91_9FIRM|nr:MULTISPECIES: GNAT family N-acetyltransferase [Carboxydocella]AVX20819.1 acetoin utilization protein AcuA [Carboxydocella thermautotrophica]AVX31238.1 acetoin utilization protein AcuA [Carboxydocella thermautotrophica]SKA06649.1 acetoin utilization protein AcuA [Carboxydocella sporoproducens DSM 16521]GAW30011.1 acetoin dehydrogenase [Carboxydocella sp. ULO1]GAW32084.1 acetoin dehydrogenase [Carboxydocella sp. JDF658]
MRRVQTDKGEVAVGGPLTEDVLACLQFDPGLTAFRRPHEQHRALQQIAAMPEGRVYGCIADETLVGYVTFHPAEEEGRWGKGEFAGFILELGAIEISPEWRGFGLAGLLLQETFCDDFWEDYIVISQHLHWHWDLKGTGLDLWGYKKMLSHVMEKGGFQLRNTDEPEIASHPANMLRVRIGKRVPAERVIQFEGSLYQNLWML